MTDQDRTIKFTFTTEDKDLLKSLAKVNEEAEKLSANLGKISKVSKVYQTSKSTFEAKADDPKKNKEALDAAKDLLSVNEDLLKVLKKQREEHKKIARASRGVGGGGGGRGRGANGSGSGGGDPALGFLGVGSAVGKTLLKVITATVGAAGAAVAAQMRLGYGAYADYAGALGGLAGTGTTYKQMDTARHAAVQYGYTPEQTAQQALAASIATGQGSSVTTAQMFSRATSLDVGQTTDFMGQLTRGGHGFGGQGGTSGKREFQQVISLGFKSGIDEARLPEFIQSAGKVMTAQGARLAGDVSASDTARILQAFGATNAAGLQGARGGAVLSQLDASIANPGGGEAGQAIMLQAMGFGKPGGDTSYYEAIKMQEEGANPENMKRIFGEFGSQFGTKEEILALKEVTGITATVLEKVRDAYQTMEGPDRDAEVKKILEGSQSAEDRAATSMEEVGFHTKRIAELQNRLVNVGDGIYHYIKSMQDSLNRTLSYFVDDATVLTGSAADLAAGVVSRFPEDAYNESSATRKTKLLPGVGATSDFLSGSGFAFGSHGSPEQKEFEAALNAPSGLASIGSSPYAKQNNMSKKKLGRIQRLIQGNPDLYREAQDALKSTHQFDDKAFFDKFDKEGNLLDMLSNRPAAKQMDKAATKFERAVDKLTRIPGVPSAEATDRY